MIGFAGALVMGFVLGLMGAGGAILTVPILVYLFKIPAQVATGYSLFIVGATSMIGAGQYYLAKQLRLKQALIFALPTIVGVYVARRYLLPELPDPMISIQDWSMDKDAFLLIFFAILMLVSSIMMIRQGPSQTAEHKTPSKIVFGIRGLIIGLIIGMLGAGGGFLIIPALVLMEKMEMKVAVGTSLTIITLNSLFGFIGELQVTNNVDWYFLMQFMFFAIFGLFIGTFASKQIDGKKLKPIFGYFVLLMGTGILFKELFF